MLNPLRDIRNIRKHITLTLPATTDQTPSFGELKKGKSSEKIGSLKGFV
jgi:hypothetical protein